LCQRATEGGVAALGPADAPHPEQELLRAVSRLWVRGHAVDWAALDPRRPVRRAVLPGYPYQRRRAWIDPQQAGAPVPPADEPKPSPFRAFGWVEAAARSASPPPATKRTALVLLPPDGTNLPVLDAVRAAGYAPTPVTFPARLDLERPSVIDEALRAC